MIRLALFVLLVALTTAVWLTGSAQPETAAAGVGDGRSLFLAKGCVLCHQGPDVGTRVGDGPSLADVTDVDPNYLRASIVDPQASVAPAYRSSYVQMPKLAVSPAEVDALVEYLTASGG